MHDGQGSPLWSGHTPLSTLAESSIVNRDAIGLLCRAIVTSPARMTPAVRSFLRPACVPDAATIIGRIQKQARLIHDLHRRGGEAGSGAQWQLHLAGL